MRNRIIVLLTITVLLVPVNASAYSFDLGTPNSAIGAFTGPYVHVDVTLVDSTRATIAASGLVNGAYTYFLGDGGSIGLNVNGTVTVYSSTLTGSNSYSGFDAPIFSLAGSGNEDGFGAFNFRLDNFDGWSHTVNSLSFTLTNTSGTWSSASDVLTNNANGYLAAAHVFVSDDSPPTVAGGAVATGYAANGTQVPEPTTMLLLGLGLMGLAGARRKFKN